MFGVNAIPFLPSSLMGMLFVVLANKRSETYAIVLPDNCETLGSVTKILLKLNYGTNVEKTNAWKKGEVWEKLRDILVDELGVELDEIKPEARFVRDLGLD